MRSKSVCAVGVGVLALLVTACGGTAENQDQGAAGSSGSGALPAGADNNTSGTAANGGAADNGGTGMSGGQDNGAALQCTRTAECKSTCSAKVGACLLPQDGSALVEATSMGSRPLAFDATVTAVSRDAWPENTGIGCIGEQTAERIHVVLQDAAGKAFDLSLSTEQFDEQHFSVGDELSLDFLLNKKNIFYREQRLVIRSGEQMDAFFLDSWGTFPAAVKEDYTAADGVSEDDDSGLRFSLGDMTCPWSVPSESGCSSAKFATVVSAGTDAVADPCDEQVGDFKLTASYLAAGQAPAACNPVTGFCDAFSQFVAAGVRTK